jgi:pyrroloquinoline quinone biosynthesis protein B
VFPSPEDNVGLILNDTRSGSRCAYIPSASSSPTVSGYVRDATSLFFDGTFYSSDELIRLGVSTRRAEDMAHLPVGGADGSVEALKQLRCRRIYIHVNNTNPILDAGSEERRFVCDAGWEVAYDGMEVEA